MPKSLTPQWSISSGWRQRTFPPFPPPDPSGTARALLVDFAILLVGERLGIDHVLLLTRLGRPTRRRPGNRSTRTTVYRVPSPPMPAGITRVTQHRGRLQIGRSSARRRWRHPGRERRHPPRTPPRHAGRRRRAQRRRRVRRRGRGPRGLRRAAAGDAGQRGRGQRHARRSPFPAHLRGEIPRRRVRLERVRRVRLERVHRLEDAADVVRLDAVQVA